VILGVGVSGVPSFIQVNVSGGDPCEVQDNVRGSPTKTVTIDDDGGSITGAAVQRDER